MWNLHREKCTDFITFPCLQINRLLSDIEIATLHFFYLIIFISCLFMMKLFWCLLLWWIDSNWRKCQGSGINIHECAISDRHVVSICNSTQTAQTRVYFIVHLRYAKHLHTGALCDDSTHLQPNFWNGDSAEFPLANY